MRRLPRLRPRRRPIWPVHHVSLRLGWLDVLGWLVVLGSSETLGWLRRLSLGGWLPQSRGPLRRLAFWGVVLRRTRGRGLGRLRRGDSLGGLWGPAAGAAGSAAAAGGG